MKSQVSEDQANKPTGDPERGPVWLNMKIGTQLDEAYDQLKFAPNRDQMVGASQR